MIPRSPVEIMREAWGDAAPDWVKGLAAECAASSQNRVAARMGRSASLVSQVLGNKYKGDLAAVEVAFNGAFRDAVVPCPALGPIPPRTCEDWRRAAQSFQNTNPTKVRMFRACNHCPRFRKAPQK